MEPPALPAVKLARMVSFLLPTLTLSTSFARAEDGGVGILGASALAAAGVMATGPLVSAPEYLPEFNSATFSSSASGTAGTGVGAVGTEVGAGAGAGTTMEDTVFVVFVVILLCSSTK
jgi:hypothetical protein